MGLDQYVISKKEISYWRKHNRLQGWMEAKWYEKNDSQEKFNCQDLYLDLNDINELEEVIMNKTLPVTEGFFFGEDSYIDYEEHYLESDLKFISDAKKALNDGFHIIYRCWW
ncbi:MAG: phosphoglycerate kinase [Pelagibacterales bacterium]|nr:phosphoglycerate kinase [Pelagibacterales bacterium]